MGSYFAVALKHSVAPIIKLHHTNPSVDRSIKTVQQLEHTLGPKRIFKKWNRGRRGRGAAPITKFLQRKALKILNHCFGGRPIIREFLLFAVGLGTQPLMKSKGRVHVIGDDNNNHTFWGFDVLILNEQCIMTLWPGTFPTI